MRKRNTNITGIVFADKPAGLGSAALTNELRRRLDGTRVGHTGTLDRFASGLMILLAGRATVFSDHFLHMDKSYRAVFRFGSFTDTHDPEGAVLESRSPEETHDFLKKNSDRIQKAVLAFKDQKEQTPPLFSALKKEGERFSDRARKGSREMPAPRPIRVDRADIVQFDEEAGSIEVELRVSSGTYIRSFARDLAEFLEFPAHLSALRRLSIGPYSLDDPAVWRPNQADPRVKSIQETLAGWPSFKVDLDEAKAVQNGRVIQFGVRSSGSPTHGLIDSPTHGLDASPGCDFLILGPDGEVLAWARTEKNAYRYIRVFSD